MTNPIVNQNTDFSKNHFLKGDLRYVNISNANLIGANFHEAKITGAVFDGAIAAINQREQLFTLGIDVSKINFVEDTI